MPVRGREVSGILGTAGGAAGGSGLARGGTAGGSAGGLAGFSSGFVKRALGYHMLSNLGSVAALTLLIVALRAVRPTGAPAPA